MSDKNFYSVDPTHLGLWWTDGVGTLHRLDHWEATILEELDDREVAILKGLVELTLDRIRLREALGRQQLSPLE